MTQQNEIPKNIETETLQMFQSPVLLITYDGIKKVDITGIEKYELQTSAGTIPKVNIVCSLLVEAADKLGDALRINKKLEAEKLRTDKNPYKRPKVIGKRPMGKILQKLVKITLRSGHVFIGIPIEYNQYNFTMNVNNQMILIYRHAVYSMEIVPKA